jgi:hypothetical protein
MREFFEVLQLYNAAVQNAVKFNLILGVSS